MIELYIFYLYFNLLNKLKDESFIFITDIINNVYLVRDLIRSAWINFITYVYFVAK